MNREQALQLLRDADVVLTKAQCDLATARVAREINAAIGDTNPLVLAVMGGATVFAGQLLPQLDFPLEFDYLHVTRYGDKTHGGALTWRVEPHAEIRGRTVLVLDDILDEGDTMAAIRDRINALGAASFHNAVFCEKLIDKAKPIRPDFTGITVPQRYVFGYGMDVKGWWRNLPAVYAMKGH